MPLVVPDDGEINMLGYIVNKIQPTNLTVRLYSQPIDLTGDDFSASDFSEVSVGGYASVTLTGSNWTISTVAGISSAVASNVTFNMDSGVDIYGYYVTSSEDIIMWAEEFPSPPFRLPAEGGQVVIVPRVQLN